MATSDPKSLHTRADAVQRASIGAHRPLCPVEVPAGAEALLNKPICGAVLTIDGVYAFLIPTAGLTSLKVFFRATLDSMTVESAGPDAIALYKADGTPFDATADDVGDAVVLESGSNDGSVSTATLQTATLSLSGETYAIYTLTLAGTPTSVTVTVAEYAGL